MIWTHESTDDDRILLFCLKLFVRLLGGGNPAIQESLFEFFVGSEHSEKFFRRVFLTMGKEIGRLKEKTNQKRSKLFQRLLRLLQLFCEGHFLKLQNYLKTQSNSKVNYDLVTLTVKSLEVLELNNENFEVISQCLDTLTEYAQGPCHANQATLVNSKFLDFAVEILNVIVLFLI